MIDQPQTAKSTPGAGDAQPGDPALLSILRAASLQELTWVLGESLDHQAAGPMALAASSEWPQRVELWPLRHGGATPDPATAVATIDAALMAMGFDATSADPQHDLAAGSRSEDAAAAAGFGSSALVLCDGGSGSVAALVPAPAAGTLPPSLLKAAGARACELLEMQRLQASLARLAQAEQLQHALFAIADMAGSDRDMPSLLRGLHGIVAGLMYAENFYIALYDRQRDCLRFIYFIDTDTDADSGPQPDEDVPLAALEHGLTWYVIRDRKPLMGSHERIAEQVSGPMRPRGADSLDWLGVPMVRDGEVRGALVVQNYRYGDCYHDTDLAVLAFVAEHVLTALERKQVQEDLEQRVADRTRELAQANSGLHKQVLERLRAEHLQATLYRIAALANTDESSERFYRHIHHAVGELINVENFYIGLLSEDGTQLEFPYSVDARDSRRSSRPLGRGFSEYVIRHGKALLAGAAEAEALVAAGELAKPSAAPAHCWLGVPLAGASGVMGVMAVQSYRDDLTYDAGDAELLTFVSYQIASSLQRRHSAESLRRLNADLEDRVVERTRELSEQIEVREQVEAKLKHQVMHDPLSGLPNRLYLRDRIERALAGVRRNGERRFALLYLDIDRFKLFNDSLGHLAGDEVLREVSRRLAECIREPDVVARLSGDEFAILLEDSPVPQTACKVAQRIQAAMQRPMQIAGRELQTSASIGIAIGDQRYQSTDALLHDADVALYRAKSAGRQRFVLFDDSLQREAMDVLGLENELRAGLVQGEFLPYFQPLVRLADRSIVGYEALIRWQHPQRGLLVPADFLQVAEDSGLIEAIDWQMYRLACSAGSALVREGGFITLNISARHFQNADFDERLLRLTAETGMDPARLRIEVTEGTLLGDPDAVAQILDRLRASCVEAALDDFGTGYSSLGYVQRFPLKMIKIDRSFVDPLGRDPSQRSSAIVTAILALARSLGLEVVAEGIETEAQRQALIGMGCVYGQGFLFEHPQLAEHWQEGGKTF